MNKEDNAQKALLHTDMMERAFHEEIPDAGEGGDVTEMISDQFDISRKTANVMLAAGAVGFLVNVFCIAWLVAAQVMYYGWTSMSRFPGGVRPIDDIMSIAGLIGLCAWGILWMLALAGCKRYR